jgi:hypothetical protein
MSPETFIRLHVQACDRFEGLTSRELYHRFRFLGGISPLRPDRVAVKLRTLAVALTGGSLSTDNVVWGVRFIGL